MMKRSNIQPFGINLRTLKYVLCILGAVCINTDCSAQYFSKLYHLSQPDSATRTEAFRPVIEIAGEGFVAGGQSWNYSNGNTKCYIIKTNYSGDVLIEKAYGDSGEFFTPAKMDFTNDSNLVMVVVKSSYLIDSVWCMLIKSDKDIDTVFTRILSSGLKKTAPQHIAKTHDHGFIISCWTGETSNSTPIYGCVIKTDSVGNMEWSKQYGDSTNQTNLNCAIALADGGYFLLGWTGINYYDRDILLIRTDSLGNELWQQTYGVNARFDSGEEIKQLADGNFIIGGVKCLGPSVNGSCKGYLQKIDSLGNIIWSKYYGLNYNQELYNVFELDNLDLVACGFSRLTTNPSLNAGMLLKTTSNGDTLWLRTYLYDSTVTSSQDYFWDFIPTSDNGFLMAGMTNSINLFTQEAWLLKVDSVGCRYPGCVPVGISEVATTLNNEGLLLFPNPTQSFSNIKLPPGLYNQFCELTITDITGRVVYKDSFMADSRNSTFPLRTGNFPSGIYMVRVKGYEREFYGKLVKE